jgi:REP element-mobilizing transposase RayT
MVLNPYGEIVRQEWFVSAHVRSEIELDVYVIMPNHLHAIVIIVGSVVPTADWTGDHRSPLPRGPKNKSLGSLVAGFKAATTRRINELAGTRSQSVWQRNYYERIIRDDSELNRIRQYIEENPDRWRFDPDNPYVLESENH